MKEELDKGIAEESSKSLVQLALSIFKSLKKKALDEIQIKKASKNYFDNYVERNGYIKVLGMLEPRPIQEIYTNVIIISPTYLNKEKEIESLEKSFRESKRQFTNDSTLSGIDIANVKKKLNILGPPGSGKSTFLKRLGMHSLLKNDSTFGSEKYQHNCIPILIELKRFRNESIDLKVLIQKEFEIAGFPESQTFVEKALKDGKLLILLDGLDEVPKNKLDITIDNIKDFTDKYGKNRFVTSCRTAFYKTYLKSFADIEIAPFNDKQIKRFIKNWFNSSADVDAGVYSRFVNLLFDRSHKSTLELARTPLLLTFLCLTFDESQRFPANRSNLYKRALFILLEKWAAEKRIHNDDIYQNLTSELEVEMLSEIAASFFEENKIFFFTEEVKQSIKLFMENSMDTKVIDLSKVLEAIEVQQGLLVQRAPDIYSFSHLTIQEYLTAHYFNTPKGIQKIVRTYLFDKRWREVFLLLAGIGKSDELLLSMMSFLIDYTKTNEIYKKVKSWIKFILEPTDNYEIDACKKTFLVGLILQSINNQEFFKRTNQNGVANQLLASLNSSFAKSYSIINLITDKNSDPIVGLVENWKNKSIKKNAGFENKSYTAFPSRLDHITLAYQRMLIPFYNKLQVPTQLVFFPKTEYIVLLNYLEAYSLIADCKKASLRLSKESWKVICLNLFN